MGHKNTQNASEVTHRYKLPLPRLKDGFGFIFIPVYVVDLIVVLEVLIQLLRTHQQERSLERLRTAKHEFGVENKSEMLSLGWATSLN